MRIILLKTPKFCKKNTKNNFKKIVKKVLFGALGTWISALVLLNVPMLFVLHFAHALSEGGVLKKIKKKL